MERNLSASMFAGTALTVLQLKLLRILFACYRYYPTAESEVSSLVPTPFDTHSPKSKEKEGLAT